MTTKLFSPTQQRSSTTTCVVWSYCHRLKNWSKYILTGEEVTAVEWGWRVNIRTLVLSSNHCPCRHLPFTFVHSSVKEISDKTLWGWAIDKGGFSQLTPLTWPRIFFCRALSSKSGAGLIWDKSTGLASTFSRQEAIKIRLQQNETSTSEEILQDIATTEKYQSYCSPKMH